MSGLKENGGTVHEKTHIRENFYMGKVIAWAFGIIGTLMAVGIIQLVGSLNSINQALSRLDERYIGQQAAIIELRSSLGDRYTKTQALGDHALIERDLKDHEKRISSIEKNGTRQ